MALGMGLIDLRVKVLSDVGGGTYVAPYLSNALSSRCTARPARGVERERWYKGRE